MKHMIKTGFRPFPGIIYVTNKKDVYERQFRKVFGKENRIGDGITGRCSEGCDKNGNVAYVIYANGLSSLVHELSHATISMMNDVGNPIDDKNSETFTYMIAQLFRDCQSLYDADLFDFSVKK